MHLFISHCTVKIHKYTPSWIDQFRFVKLLIRMPGVNPGATQSRQSDVSKFLSQSAGSKKYFRRFVLTLWRRNSHLAFLSAIRSIQKGALVDFHCTGRMVRWLKKSSKEAYDTCEHMHLILRWLKIRTIHFSLISASKYWSRVFLSKWLTFLGSKMLRWLKIRRKIDFAAIMSHFD